jgi:hypothetical protein
MSPRRVQQKRVKGWRKPPGAIAIGRGTRWGNEVTKPTEKTPEAHRIAVAGYREWFMHADQAAFRAEVRRDLRGHDLMCPGCKDGWPCHGDVLLEWANSAEE